MWYDQRWQMPKNDCIRRDPTFSFAKEMMPIVWKSFSTAKKIEIKIKKETLNMISLLHSN